MSVVSYPALATPADLITHGMMGTSFGKLTTDQIAACILSASDEVYSELSGRFAPPYTEWDSSVVMNVCKIAAWELMNLRGYNPAAAADKNVKDRADQAREWIKGVKNKAIHPRITAGALQPTFNQPIVRSSSTLSPGGYWSGIKRGW